MSQNVSAMTIVLSRLFANETAKYDGDPPPETRLLMGQVGAVLVPMGR